VAEKVSAHLQSGDLEQLVALTVAPEEAHALLMHLLLCQQCRTRLLRRFPGEGGVLLNRLQPFPTLAGEESEEPAGPEKIDWKGLPEGELGNLAATYRRVYREEAEAPELYRQLNEIPAPRRQILLCNSRRFRTLGLLKYVLETTTGLWHQAPEVAEEHARLAVEVYRNLPTGEYHPRPLADFGARAFAHLANVLRLRGDLAGAEKEIERAWRLLQEEGSGDPLDRAYLGHIRAKLRTDQRRFEEALHDCERAARLYRRIKDRRGEATLELLRSTIFGDAERIDEAVVVLLDLSQEFSRHELGDRLYFGVLHGLAIGLAQLGRSFEAQRYLPEIRRLAQEIFWGLGRTERAATIFRNLLEIFQRHQMAYDAALVALDLAALSIETGDTERAKSLAQELFPIFRSLRVDREALASLELFAQAVQQEVATVAMAKELGRLLKTKRHPSTPSILK